MVYGHARKAKKQMTNAPSIQLKGNYYFENKPLFENIAMDIPSAKWTCLLGASGVGKSTILRLILNLETGGDFSGEIGASDGLPLTNRVSYMAQTDLLLPWLNVLDNICLGARIRGEEIQYENADALIEKLGLSAHKTKFPQELSGGMRQRVALGRALMEDRPVILLDEPFSALDAHTRADMQELAFQMLRHKTVLLVTHDPAEASRLGDQIVILSAKQAAIWQTPTTSTIRAVNAPETIACQAALFENLRGKS